jgi:HEAT repeats
MRKKLDIAMLLVLLASVLAIGAWAFSQPPEPVEPVYAGKPVSYWIASKTEDSFDCAVTGIPKLDSNAIPYLLRATHRQNRAWDGYYLKVWQVAPVFLQKITPTPERPDAIEIRGCAVAALGRVGTNSQAAISNLLDTLKNDPHWGVRSFALQALLKVGKGNATVTQAVITALNDPVPYVRAEATNTLRQLDPDAAGRILKQ